MTLREMIRRPIPMKRLFFLVTSVAAIAASTSAFAADAVDQIPTAPVAVDAATTFDWSGAYIGAHTGYGLGYRQDQGSRLRQLRLLAARVKSGAVLSAGKGLDFVAVMAVSFDIGINWAMGAFLRCAEFAARTATFHHARASRTIPKCCSAIPQDSVCGSAPIWK